MRQAPKPSRKSAVALRIAHSRGPINKLRARRLGMDILLHRPPVLELYYESGDPHSHLCLQSLSRWKSRLGVEVQAYIVPPPRAEAYPESEKQRSFALADARYVAPAWGLQFPENAQTANADDACLAARLLLACKDINCLLEKEPAVAGALFSRDSKALERMLSESEALDERSANLRLAANENRRNHLGHYLPGMWQFNGEWFWALDRLHQLESRLRDFNALQGELPLAVANATKARLPAIPGDKPVLEFFFSFRSPYSYLAAMQVRDKHAKWPAELRIRPVLPMAMRGLPVPLEKRLYIVRDVKREADSLGIPFGRIADPIGAGAERCLSLFPLAQGVEQQLAYLTAAATAIWSQGVDVATDKGLAYVCDQAGLDWAAARQRLQGAPDLGYAEENRRAMFEAGLWGVPSFRLGKFATWGRDRLWMVEEVLRRGSD